MINRYGIILLTVRLCCFASTDCVIDENRYVESNENTRAAIDELNEVLRYLFPIVPHKSHLIWSSRHRGILINQPSERQLLKTQHKAKSSSYHTTPNKSEDYEEEEEEIASRAKATKPRAGLEHSLGPTGPGTRLLASDQLVQRQSPVPVQDTVLAPSEAGIRLSDSSQGLPKVNLAPSVAEKHLQSKIYNLVLNTLQSKSPNRGEMGRNPSKPELTTPSLGKRGPECMRRCIMQGLLHPVQCHSLC